jgi:hypothetical protein
VDTAATLTATFAIDDRTKGWLEAEGGSKVTRATVTSGTGPFEAELGSDGKRSIALDIDVH